MCNAGVLEEARFFGISKAIEPLELMVQNEELALSGHFTRKEFLRMLSITSSSATLRCQVGGCGWPESTTFADTALITTMYVRRVLILKESTCRTLTFGTSTSSVLISDFVTSPTATSLTVSLRGQTCTMPT